MANNKKDMRREDLAVPYVAPPKKASDSDISGMLATTLPMAAMFTRNRQVPTVGWTAVLFALQNWLSETPEQKKTSAQPGLVTVGLAVLSLGVTYMQLFIPQRMPQGPATGTGTSTEAPPAMPPTDEAW
ncbi:MAG: hypothetical protein M1816_000734 [Peltula sp. TS41687]|nr:MAG: hypothetical protein M1816_000734 [Peltula sp. TS41687]